MKNKIEKLIIKLQELKLIASKEVKNRNSNYSQQWCMARIETLDYCIFELQKITNP